MSSDPQITFAMSRSSGGAAITAFIPGKPPKTANSDHPNFRAIREALAAEDFLPEEVLGLFSGKPPVKTMERRFAKLTDRVSHREGVVYFDGDPVHAAVADSIIQLITEGKPHMPWVRFMEKLYDNPQANSVEQAYRWISSQRLTITEEGDVVGYKGCKRHDDGVLYSTSSGKAIVDGVEHRGYIPYPLGSMAEMPRSEVVHDPGSACSTGLHVGTFSYAKGFGDTVVEVHVNPRDIVSVPKGEDQKMRVCRLRVVKEVEGKYQSALRPAHAPTNHLAPEPLDSEFASCEMCQTCGECKTHDECICATVEKQKAEVAAQVSEKNAEFQVQIIGAAEMYGITWEPTWTEVDGRPVANYGPARCIVDDDERGLASGDQGELTAEVVGDVQYRNQRVSFAFAPADRPDSPEEVNPLEDVEPLTPKSTPETPQEPAEDAAAYPVDEDGLEPEDDENEVPESVEPVRREKPRHPSKAKFAEIQVKSKTRRRPIRSLVESTKSLDWTLIEGDGTERKHWAVG